MIVQQLAEPSALWIERSPPGRPRWVHLRHPLAPCVGDLLGGSETDYRRVALDYLHGRQAELELAPTWLRDLQADHWPDAAWREQRKASLDLHWLPIRSPKTGLPSADPRHSFWVLRHAVDGSGALLDRSLVLLAALHCAVDPADASSERVPIPGLGGLRLVLRIWPQADGTTKAHISSVVAALPAESEIGACSAWVERIAQWRREAVEDRSAALVAYPDHRVTDFGAVIGRDFRGDYLDAYVDAEPSDPKDPRPVRRIVTRHYRDDPSAVPRPRRSYQLCCGLEHEVIRRDPPTRFRDPNGRRPQDVLRQPDVAEPASVHASMVKPRVEVGAPVDFRGAPVPKEIEGLSRRSAEATLDEFFDLVQGFGLDVHELLKFAPGPMEVLPYAALPGPGGREGRAVNAQVAWQHRIDLLRPAAPAQVTGRIGLQMRFGVAELRSRPGRAISLACDPRWAWHELAHLIIGGSTGWLELPFAHSVGDAMGAVRFDPDSAQRGDPLWRGATFPWVRLARRHDRQAARGWSWSGTLGRYRAAEPPQHESTGASYLAEQLMSSSLFRLYLALGGDARDLADRQHASDYTLYLVMRAIALLGPSAWSTAPSVDCFVSALIDADLGTSAIELPVSEARSGAAMPRLGGAASKIIRWAFEQQGLYPPPDARPPWNGEGCAEAVDVYLADRCGGADYAPRPLQPMAAVRPAEWIDQGHSSTLTLKLEVGNRGSRAGPAGGVELRAWCTTQSDWRRLQWDPAAWDTCTAAWQPFQHALNPIEVPADGRYEATLTLGGLEPEQRRHCRVLVAITCAADRCLLDPASGLPCAQRPGPLWPLLLGDNNLALIEPMSA